MSLNLPEEQEAAQVEEFIKTLRKDPAAPAPAGLDQGLAEMIRLADQAESEATKPVASQVAAARSRAWRKVLENSRPVNDPKIVAESIEISPAKNQNAGRNGKISAAVTQEKFSPRKRINWQRMVLAGMGATILLIVFAFSVFIVTTTPGEGGAYPNIVVGASQVAATSGPALTATPPVAPTKPAQPTPTPEPAYKVTVSVDTLSFTSSQIQSTVDILENRLKAIGITYVKSSVALEKITLELRGKVDKDLVKSVVTKVGRIELVDAGKEVVQAGEVLQTSYCTTGSLLKLQSGLCGSTYQPEPSRTIYSNQAKPRLNQAGDPFQTVLTGEDFDQIGSSISLNTNQNYSLSFQLKPEAATIMKNFTESHLGHQLAVTSDRQVIVAATIQGVISDKGEITAQSKQDLSIMLAYPKSGPLPLSVRFVDMTGP